MPGGAKIGDDKAVGGEEEIGGFDVAVDDILAVEVGEAGEKVMEEGKKLRRRGEGEGGGEGERVVGEGENEVGVRVVERGDKGDDVGVS